LKYIEKHASPKQFEEWKSYKNPINWNELDGYPVPIEKRIENHAYYSKEELRQALIDEQYSTCCYCESAIENHPLKTKIEHLEPREGDTRTNRIFDYSNLMASCDGGERDQKPRKIHCDAAKGKKEIPISPLDKSKRCETEISFTIEGKIIGTTPDAKNTISILRLDLSKLNNLREEAIAGYIFSDLEKTNFISAECDFFIDYIKTHPSEPFKTSILFALNQLK